MLAGLELSQGFLLIGPLTLLWHRVWVRAVDEVGDDVSRRLDGTTHERLHLLSGFTEWIDALQLRHHRARISRKVRHMLDRMQMHGEIRRVLDGHQPDGCRRRRLRDGDLWPLGLRLEARQLNQRIGRI